MDRRRFVGTSALGTAAAAVAGTTAIAGSAAVTHAHPSASSAAIHPPSPELLADLERLMEIGGVPGVGIGVVQDGRLAWEHHAGLGNVARRRPVGPDTLHSAASLSKQLFAYAALRLVDRGLLDLDAPLKSYVPDHTPAHEQADRVTPRHVLCHSSGFPNWRQEDVPLAPALPPGTAFRYSGEGYYYLQRAVENVTGMGFERFMQESLLGPLGMTDSSYVWSADAEERATEGYNKGDARWPSAREFSLRLSQSTTRGTKPVAELRHEDIVQALGGVTPKPRTVPNALAPNCAFTLLTTVRDYCAFLAQVLTNGSEAVALAPATRAAMSAPAVRINSALSWSLGWGIQSEAARAYLWQWGDNGSWKNHVLVHEPSRSAIVVFTNGATGARLIERILRAATGHDQAAYLWI